MLRGVRWLGLLVVGCTSSPLSIAPLPHPGSSLVVGFKRSGAESWAMQVTRGDEPLYLALDDSPFELVAYSYSALDLPPGPLPSEALRDCSLLYYDLAYEASISQASQTVRWGPATPPTLLLDEHIFGQNRERCTGGCWTWTEDADAVVPEGVDTVFAAESPLGVLIGEGSGALQRVDLDGSLTRVCSASPSMPGIATAAGWNGGDELWVGYLDGTLARLSLSAQRPELPCALQTATVTPDRLPIRALAVAPPEAPFELFSISSTQGHASYFRRWDGSAFRQQLVVPDAHPTSAEIAWLSPGSALGVVVKPSLLLLSPSGPETLSLGIDVTGVSRALGESVVSDGAGGAWVGVGHLGPMHFHPPDGIDVSLASEEERTVRSLVRQKDRSFFLSDEGLMAQVPDRAPRCTATKVFTATAPGARTSGVSAIRRLGPTRLLAVQADERDIREVLLRRRHLVLGLHRP